MSQRIRDVFKKPLTAEEALGKAKFWWNAEEVQQILPTVDSMQLFFDWMNQHRLGRKRILDTQLAATLWKAGARRIFSSNPTDFQLLGFDVIVP